MRPITIRNIRAGKDPRYQTAKFMFEAGKMKSFLDLFKYVPKTVVAKNIGVKVDTFTIFMRDPGGWRIEYLADIAELMEVDVEEFLRLAVAYYRDSQGLLPGRKQATWGDL